MYPAGIQAARQHSTFINHRLTTYSTKVESLAPKAHGREKANESMQGSLEALGFKEGNSEVDVMFLHAPNLDTPFEEVAEVMVRSHEQRADGDKADHCYPFLE